MFLRSKNSSSYCNISKIFPWGGVVLAGVLAFSPVTAAEPENNGITLDKLQELTGDKMSWQELAADDGGDDTVQLGEKWFKYNYTSPITLYANLTGQHLDQFDRYFGGAIYNDSDLDNITGSFIGNSADYGGAIYNSHEKNIDSISGDFIGNSAEYSSGGAIYTYGTIDSISGDFIGNSAVNHGGAIYNWIGTIDSISGDFIGNSAEYSGGAIYTSGTIDSINGDFSGNSAEYGGGAIYNNDGDINSISGDFSGNSAEGSGGAINNHDGDINSISGVFSGNSAEGSGGAIYNSHGNIGSINGDFIGNSADDGGAIYTSRNIDSISGDFSGNSAVNSGGAIYNNNGDINSISGDFSGNSASSVGGAIYNRIGTIDSISGVFSGNSAEGSGGAIYNQKGTIDSISGDFSGNSAEYSGGAIYNNDGDINSISGDFSGNSAEDSGGAIYIFDGDITLTNASFYDNYVTSSTGKGGAIYSYGGNLNIVADGGESIFSGNGIYEATADGGYQMKDSQALYADLTAKTTLKAVNNGLIRFDDKIESSGFDTFTNRLHKLEQQGYTITDNGDGSYALSLNQTGEINGIVMTATSNGTLINNGSEYQLVLNQTETMKQTMVMDRQTVEENLQQMADMGAEITQDGDNWTVSLEMSEQGNTIKASAVFTLQPDGSYLVDMNETQSINDVETEKLDAPDLIITGDASGKVELNNAVNGFRVDISQTNVELNKAGARPGATVSTGGGLDVNDGSFVRATTINADGSLNINAGGKAINTHVNDGGKMHLAADGTANDTVVEAGGTLSAEMRAKLNNLLANGGAILDIDSGAVLTGDIILDAKAELGGSYDYSQIFKDEVQDSGSLTLVGGLNDYLVEDSLVNNVEAKALKLTDGYYTIGGSAQAVAGWDEMVIKDQANVKLEGNIAMSGAEKNIKLLQGSTLDLSGHSPTNYEIIGSFNNDGTINFSHAGDGADDVTTIYGNYKAYDNAQMTIDVDPVNNVADKLVVEGDVAGTTKVTLNPLSDGKSSDKILFVEALNDMADTEAHFEIFRVIGDAQVWNVLYENQGWYVGTENIIADSSNNGYGDATGGETLEDNDEDAFADAVLPPNFELPDSNDNTDGNITGGKTKVYAEAVAYAGLISAGLEQTRGLVDKIAANVASAKTFNSRCGGYYDRCYDGYQQAGVWAAPEYTYARLDAPIEMEADITGFEGGFDIQHDANNRLGIFMSFRRGNYDLDGGGDDIYADKGSEIELNSYLAGLYYRHDRGRAYTLATLYGGWLDADISTDDGVSADTDGWQIGAGIETGKAFALRHNLILRPLLSLTYNQIMFDDAADAYGKTAEYDTVRNLAVEAGINLEKQFNAGYYHLGKIYIRPSLIQNFGEGSVRISGIDEVDGIDDNLLARVKAGGNFEFDDKWSGYADAAYTFGSDYQSVALTAGVRYSF